MNINNSFVHCQLGSVLMKIKRYKEEVHFDKAIQMNRGTIDLYFNKGIRLSKMNKYQEAIYEIIQFNPQD